MSCALLFPGQGSQFVGMGRGLHDRFASVRSVYQEAEDVLGIKVREISFDGPDDLLNATEFTQPLVLTANIAAYRVWLELTEGLQPISLAGLSLGEYAALVVAESISFADALLTVRKRGLLMQQAVPRGVGGMAAILGLDHESLETICTGVRSGGAFVGIANYNCPDQLVISGQRAPVREVCRRALEAGARRALPLPVSAPFHSPLLEPAGEGLAEVLAAVPVRDAVHPVISNVTAEPVQAADAIRRLLVLQVSHPVRFQQSLEYICREGPVHFYELGPGKVLSGFVRAVHPGSPCLTLEDLGTAV